MTISTKVGRSRTQAKRIPRRGDPCGAIRIRMATLAMVSVVCLVGSVVTAWFAGEPRVSRSFAQLNALQKQPPVWIEAPTSTVAHLLGPTVLLLLGIFLITRVLSPRPRAWSRTIVVTLLLFLLGRYVAWRSLSTLKLSDPLNGTFSLLLFCMEMIVLLGSIIRLVLLLRVSDRRRQADQLCQSVLDGCYSPSVDVFIPTYDEPAFILRRTVIGCQGMDYPHKHIYLLDDTRRPEIRSLAAELGCHYLTRPDNRHAKAGNLNHALFHTNSELVVSFDADFVPTRNFLTRTIGFFRDPSVGLVQTPQSFYNSDPIARNLGLEDVLTPEEEVFYRQIQPMRDGSGSVVCSGTSFVARRSALETTHGFVTDSLSEDYFTAVRLAAQGYRIIYLDEKLSAGLAAENIAAHATQRLRWARGTLQAFFIDSNPLTIRGLTLMQRLGHLEGLIHWFSSIPRIVFLLMPLSYSFLEVIPIQATTREMLYFFLPYYLVQILVFAWLNNRSRSALLSDIYSLVLVFPLAFTVIQAMVSPFAKGFKVTPKGTSSARFSFNWSLAWPLILVFALTFLSIGRNLEMLLTADESAEIIQGLGLGWIWSIYNLVMVGIALLILLDAPRPDPYPWFDLRRTVRLSISQEDDLPEAYRGFAGRTWWGSTTAISEANAQIALTQSDLPSLSEGETLPVDIYIPEENLFLRGSLQATDADGEFPMAQVAFQPLDLSQQRVLVALLFCRPGQWKRWDTPGEVQSLELLLKILVRSRILTRNRQTKALAVGKG